MRHGLRKVWPDWDPGRTANVKMMTTSVERPHDSYCQYSDCPNGDSTKTATVTIGGDFMIKFSTEYSLQSVRVWVWINIGARVRLCEQ